MINIVGFGGTEIQCFEDWALYGLPPSRRDLHWKQGRSAFELGRSWTTLGGCVAPPEFTALLNSHRDFSGAEIANGFVEHETKLPFGSSGPRCHDLMLLATREGKRIVICIEAKADERFGKTLFKELQQSLKRSAATQFPMRLDWLTRLLLRRSAFHGELVLEPSLSGLFYQLFSGIGGTLIEAELQDASAAVLVLHEFRTDETSDSKLQFNSDALSSFLNIFFEANDISDDLVEGEVVGPIWLNPSISDLGFQMPKHIPLYLGKIRTDRRVIR